MTSRWWRDAVIYQIYPRSFADANGDGVGDLRGIIERLDHLAWLGIDTLWLTPIMPSPNTDWGYDVSEYCDVHPELGTLADFDDLVAEAGRRGIRIVGDLVPNHTSHRHPWFIDARSSRTASHRNWYVWADPRPDGSPPNNWVSNFGGPAWTLDEMTGQYYLHLFLPTQPDLNWWCPEVAEAFDGILRFWFDRGLAGFRIDVCHAIVKDRELRDNPPATENDPPQVRAFGQRHVYSANRPEVHDVLRRWRSMARGYEPERLLLGETYVWNLADLVAFYGRADDELHLAFNIPFVLAPFEADRLRSIVERVEALLPPHAWPVWTGSNHDALRLATRWCGGHEARIRLALLLLLSLRGTPVLYYGDEIGLECVRLEREELRDPVGLRFYPAYAGRDPGRTPMPWTGGANGGFCPSGVRPWLPVTDVRRNVADQRSDPGSILHLVRDLVRLRRSDPELGAGAYKTVPSPAGTWCFTRGGQYFVALNMSGAERRLDVEGTVVLSTGRERDGDVIRGALVLGPWEGAIVRRRFSAYPKA